MLKGKKLAAFIEAYNTAFATDINVARKIRSISVFDFRSFLNMAMLLSESENARTLRQLMLDIVIDIINRKTGGGTKYINQRDKDFLFSSLQEDNYRRQFTDALKNYVEDDRYKYAHFTGLIYVSIFKEKAKEYKRVGHILSQADTEELFHRFENMALWKPLIQRGRVKMASRDMVLRDAYDFMKLSYLQEAAPLLQKIKSKVAELDHWADKRETKAEIDNLIRDTLWCSSITKKPTSKEYPRMWTFSALPRLKASPKIYLLLQILSERPKRVVMIIRRLRII